MEGPGKFSGSLGCEIWISFGLAGRARAVGEVEVAAVLGYHDQPAVELENGLSALADEWPY